MQVLTEVRGLSSSGAGATGGCEPPDTDAGNRTLDFWDSNLKTVYVYVHDTCASAQRGQERESDALELSSRWSWVPDVVLRYELWSSGRASVFFLARPAL